MGDEKKTNNIRVPLALCISLCLAIAGAVWALSTEVHNYRMVNITTRLKTHEDTIRQNELNIKGLDKDVAYIRERVDDIFDAIKGGD